MQLAIENLRTACGYQIYILLNHIYMTMNGWNIFDRDCKPSFFQDSQHDLTSCFKTMVVGLA